MDDQPRLLPPRSYNARRENGRKEIETHEVASSALKRASNGISLDTTGYHPAGFYSYLANYRYGIKRQPFSTLPLADFVWLARNFKLTEWQAIEQAPDQLRAVMKMCETTIRNLESWFPFGMRCTRRILSGPVSFCSVRQS